MLDITLREINGEPRAPDLEIAARLGFSQPVNIRKLIKRNADTLEGFGSLESAQIEDGVSFHMERNLGGRPSYGYWLNEKQTLFITAKSNTPTAARITVEMVEVFAAWRAGQLEAPRNRSLNPDGIDLGDPFLPVAISMVAEARRSKGRGAAQRMWDYLGLPDVDGHKAKPLERDRDLFADILLFLQQNIYVNGKPADRITFTEMYAHYARWGRQRHIAVLGQRTFSARLREMVGRYEDPSTGNMIGDIKSNGVHHWTGVRLQQVLH